MNNNKPIAPWQPTPLPQYLACKHWKVMNAIVLGDRAYQDWKRPKILLPFESVRKNRVSLNQVCNWR